MLCTVRRRRPIRTRRRAATANATIIAGRGCHTTVIGNAHHFFLRGLHIRVLCSIFPSRAVQKKRRRRGRGQINVRPVSGLEYWSAHSVSYRIFIKMGGTGVSHKDMTLDDFVEKKNTNGLGYISVQGTSVAANDTVEKLPPTNEAILLGVCSDLIPLD